MTTQYSDNPAVQELICGKVQKCAEKGITVRLKQKIPYGTQLAIMRDLDKALINIYYSAKKGYSFVDNTQNKLSKEAVSVFQGKEFSSTPDESAAEHELTCWIGTDESGKGDFFGPLVVAGFCADREIIADLDRIGVCDSKLLASPQIHAIAEELFARYPQRTYIDAPSVDEYNRTYASVRNLNIVLAHAHARVINKLLETASDSVDGVVSDKFGDEKHIHNALGRNHGINLIQRHKGESNPAVAAASILARYQFEKEIKNLENKYMMKIPFGANRNVIYAARDYVARFGKNNLARVAKLHFKTANEI